uniref:DUF6718 family protein n=1 Tax=Eubacterium cellulosolvens TaxID=29322 RepID=UPI000481EFD5
MVAKKQDAVVCIACQSERGKVLAALVTYLGIRTLEKGIEILTLTDKDTFSEYQPYQMIDSEAEFISRVVNYSDL